ncbi:hypothetical protein CRE_24589 [Caenorhabditis remanei]|uniref:F-box domain-containing protein n=1 Tax=Caenorhabditis remanei TaxID=31234 RepID=E3MVB6_CAERE|nr:hypothetical protein CRE_24589 [Caenorhabditis remanei]
MTSPFPLLHIPSVVLKLIIDSMELNSLISLSLASHKSHSVIKAHHRKPINGRIHTSRSTPLVLSFSGHSYVFSGVDFDPSIKPSTKILEFITWEKQEVPIKIDPVDGYLKTFKIDEVDGLRTFIVYVTSLLNIDMLEISFCKQSIWLVDWVNSRQGTPLHSALFVDRKEELSEEQYLHILRDCTASVKKWLYTTAPPNFRYSEKFRKIDCLDIIDGKWVTIENLLTMDGIDICLESSSLTNTDLNVFLKHWLAGGCPRLKFFLARTGTVNILEVLTDLLEDAVFFEQRRKYTSPFLFTPRLERGYDIKREDGVIATVSDSQQGGLVIAVWPETTYNDFMA